MKRLLYGNSSQVLRLDFPDSWRASVPSAVNLVIKDNAGTELVASTAATLYSATTLASAATATATTVTFASNTDPWTEGDRFNILASVDGASENCEVLSYDSTSEVVELKERLQYNHTTGINVKPNFCVYTFDISTTTTYTKGKELTVTWTPNNNRAPITERYEIVIADFELQDIQEKFSSKYPVEYDNKRKNWDTFYNNCVELLRLELSMDGFKLSRLKEPEILNPVILPLMAYNANMSMGGDSRITERNAAFAEYTRLLGKVKQEHNWFDDDQDDIKESGETRPILPPPPSRGYL
jgi:hypothetical protein